MSAKNIASGCAPVLDIQNLTVDLPASADRPNAVENISFSIEPGKILCLVGESGSGKSVIANAIMGLLPKQLGPATGSIVLQGSHILNAPQAQLRRLRGAAMAMVFQEPMTALNPTMNCGAQVAELLAQHTQLNAAQQRKEILAIFERVKLPEPERIYASYPHQLSGGQRQRIVIAMALILKPALLICDEPTTALDVTTQAEILKLILTLQRESETAVLFITHDFGVVAEIADEVAVMQLGSMVESGTRTQVLTQPAHPYTKMLLAAVPSLSAPARPAVPDAQPLLQARDVSKVYRMGSWPGKRRQVRAALNVSLTVRPGETVGIVGESGSGKSTMARCIARLIEPTSGDIIALGRSVAHAGSRQLSPFRRHVQMVFQDPYRSLNPRQTVGASIIEGPINFGVPRSQAWRRAEQLMQLVRLSPEALHRYPHEFSGGQRQRISIARALACEAKVLIADEAVSALDVSVQAQILDLLADIQKRLSLGIIFITHDLRVASQICDSILVMHRGQVVEQGNTRQVFNTPQHPYTVKLLASAPGRDFCF
ncbi:MAG TPA: ABC transporter ATP-binding protein [Pusillimonas sp.]|uniref:ABC transporter ATP-binding protein n=1 Tax=Pusillimonas sp. TaxID=3040095 RepID=UPI002B8FF489|nr:ABC transporter ATP-binding protein [Pusillimonas sp.]HUH88649.1 ABC transporter ATP-binding protein [Pusillimonas sp.]